MTFSKQVSAEELQGQLGERLPGAVVKFANATNRTLPQLQKDLRDGTVGLNDVMKFVVKLSDDHRRAALKMAGSTEEAAQRMTVALKNLSRTFGEFFKPIGAGFQDIITGFANMVNAALSTGNILRNLQRTGSFGFQRQQELVNQAHKEAQRIHPHTTGKSYTDVFDERLNLKLKQELDKLTKSIVGNNEVLSDNTNKWKLNGETAITALDGAKEGIKDYLEKVSDMATMTKDLLGNTFKGLEDLLVDFVTKGTFEFRKFAQSIINEMARIAIRQSVMKPLTGWFGNIFSAKGNAFENGKHLTAYAKGGVIDKPHYKFMANGGIAVAGEAGSEAVLPLRRGKSGRLGVESSGGGTSVVVNVDASGDTQVTGNEQQARMLGQLVAAAVKTQIANERRPGGLLYA